MSLKPLGVVKEIVESVGMNISYAYDDLVFMEHNAFLLQFTEKEKQMIIHTNSDTQLDEIRKDVDRLKEAAAGYGFELIDGSSYTLSPVDEENIRIEFSEQ